MEEWPIPEPKDDEVQISMTAVGICGSDVHYWVHGSIGPFVVKDKMVLGHESAGIVSKCGKNVKNLKVGDRVAFEPGIPCRYCDQCKLGRYNLCKDIAFCATPPYHGTLTRFYCQAADFCFKLPDHVSFEEAACLEPLSVGVHACERADIHIGQNVLITGAGPIGLVNILVARARGATKIIITDIDENRLTVAKKFGADVTVNSKTGCGDGSPQAVAQKLIEGLGGVEPDIAIECSGAETALTTAILACKPGGTVVLVGMGGPMSKVPIVEATIKEIDLKGSFRYANNYQTALDLVASGRVDVKPLITHHFKLEETLQAFETAKTGKDGAIKVIIHCERQ